MTTTTRDLTADIAEGNRAAYRGQIANEAVTRALAAMHADGPDAAADVLRAYHDRYQWLLEVA